MMRLYRVRSSIAGIGHPSTRAMPFKVFAVAFIYWASCHTAFAAADPPSTGAASGAPSLSLVTTIEGEDADTAPGYQRDRGSEATIVYSVTNTSSNRTGMVYIEDVLTTSSGSVKRTVCALHRLEPGETRECLRQLSLARTAYHSVSRAFIPNLNYEVGDDTYFEGLPLESIEMQVTLNGLPADVSPGAPYQVGSQLDWRYVVNNTGETTLSTVQVVVDIPSSDQELVCELESLAAGDSAPCLTRKSAESGDYSQVATVTATGAFGDLSEVVSSYYTGTAALAAIPRAVPTAGAAPLTVTFSPSAVTDTAIERYEWDFDGDGNIDATDTVGRNFTYTYSVSGNYEAALTVTDTAGELASASITIVVGNTPPVVTAEASPSNGQVPLQVSFSAQASDPDGITGYQWDFDGNGVTDETTQSSSTTNVYADAGTFQPIVTVADSVGASTSLQVPSIEVRAAPVGSPSVEIFSNNTQGAAPLVVNFSANVLDFGDASSVTLYEWDFDGDGEYEISDSQSSFVTHTYETGGIFYAALRITTDTGKQAIDIAAINVTVEFGLSLSTDTIDANLSESTIVTTTLGARSTVSVVMETVEGTLVKELVTNVERNAGSYDDNWDGLDANGDAVPEGQYRAVLIYNEAGEKRRFDLGLSTGGQQYNPTRSQLPFQFFPYKEEPLIIDYTLPDAAEVTAFMGRRYTNVRLVTFLQRVPKGRGVHKVIWHGENTEGQLIHPPVNDRFLFGIFAYTLPDNAVVVKNRIEVTELSANPPIFLPNDGRETSQVSFSLSESGDATIAINDTDTGTRIRTEQLLNLSSGENTWSWDGRNDSGEFVAAGSYRIGIVGSAENGEQSTTIYALQRVYY